MTGLAAEKIRVEEATTVEVAVGVGANLSKNDVKGELERHLDNGEICHFLRRYI